MQKFLRGTLCLVVLIAACGHKAKPLFKDRMNPKLTRIRALNDRQVQLSFSEDIDTLNFNQGNITIHTDNDTLEIVTVYPSLSAAEYICLTGNQSPIKYMISGFVYDTAQNKGMIASSFTGSSIPDTVAPWIIDYSKGQNTEEFTLHFSEAMDTTIIDFIILPEHSLIAEWHGLRTCLIKPATQADMLEYGITYYLFIDQTVFDVSGNPIQQFITSITPDTTYKPFLLKGEVRIGDTLVQDGIAVLKRPNAQGITLIKNGLFNFEVRDQDTYTVEAISQEYSGSAEVWFDSVNVIVLIPEEKSLDNIIR